MTPTDFARKKNVAPAGLKPAPPHLPCHDGDIMDKSSLGQLDARSAENFFLVNYDLYLWILLRKDGDFLRRHNFVIWIYWLILLARLWPHRCWDSSPLWVLKLEVNDITIYRTMIYHHIWLVFSNGPELPMPCQLAGSRLIRPKLLVE